MERLAKALNSSGRGALRSNGIVWQGSERTATALQGMAKGRHGFAQVSNAAAKHSVQRKAAARRGVGRQSDAEAWQSEERPCIAQRRQCRGVRRNGKARRCGEKQRNSDEPL